MSITLGVPTEGDETGKAEARPRPLLKPPVLGIGEDCGGGLLPPLTLKAYISYIVGDAEL